MSLFKCAECERLRDMLDIAERTLFRESRDALQAAHRIELRAVRAEAQMELLKLEIERLERVLANRQAPTTGGFVPMDTTPDAEVDPAADADNFDSRLDEICGDGLSAAELERRQFLYRKRELDSLLAERNEITAELREMQGTE